MKIDHIHFFVSDAQAQRDWFVHRMGCRSLGVSFNEHTHTEILQYGSTDFLVSSPLSSESLVAHHLHCHAPGVVDVAFRVKDLDFALSRANVSITPSLAIPQNNSCRRATIKGWGSVRHTLIESPLDQPFRYAMIPEDSKIKDLIPSGSQIDHIVLNVPAGELTAAVDFYQQLLGLDVKQQFRIETSKSGLNSQVLHSPSEQVYFNINEPAIESSQIQVFLDANRGAGIQHIALKSQSLWREVVKLRRLGLPFIPIPDQYYQHLKNRLCTIDPSPISSCEWQKIVAQKILVDWQTETPQSLLLQIFSKPIFPQPTFFFEFLERRANVEGFGARNFQALYEAVEAELIRGNVE